MTSHAQSAAAPVRSMATGDTGRIAAGSLRDDAWHKPVFIAFLLVWLANVIIAGYGIVLPEDGLWVEALLPVAAIATTLIGFRRVLPWQNLLAMAVIIAGFGFVVMLICVRTGLPFGPLVYLDTEANPTFGVVPWWVPLLWVVLVMNARGVARLMLFRWRARRNYGLWVIGLTCLLVATFDLGLEPFATRGKHYWAWAVDDSLVRWNWFGAPVTTFLAWAICTLLVAIATVVWGINKRPVPVVPHHHPLAVWAMLNVLTMAGNGSSGWWAPVACSAGLVLASVAFSLWPGGRSGAGIRSPGFPSGGGQGPRTRG